MNTLRKKWLYPLALTAFAGLVQADDKSLEVVAETHDAIWNAVAVDDTDTMYVAGPKWTGMKGPSVSRLDASRRPHAFPDARWNSDDTSVSVSERFINVNALHRDKQGQLWIVDAGVSDFGGHVIPGAAKLVVVDLSSGKTKKVITFTPDVVRDGSYIDDIRFSGDHAYLTDAGVPGIIVLDLKSGSMRRVLDTSPAVKAPVDRDIVLSGKIVRAPNGEALRVNSDPLETSHDGKWLYFAALEGPWYKIETRWLNDASLSPAALAEKVQFWRDLPPVGGTALDKEGNFYYSDLATDTVKRIRTSGEVETVISDPNLHWVDAPTFDQEGRIYLPAAQVDRVALFNEGVSRIEWPLRVYRLSPK